MRTMHDKLSTFANPPLDNLLYHMGVQWLAPGIRSLAWRNMYLTRGGNRRIMSGAICRKIRERFYV